MVLPIGGAVVSRSGVVLLELMPGSMCRYRFQAATGQMRWSDREERGWWSPRAVPEESWSTLGRVVALDRKVGHLPRTCAW